MKVDEQIRALELELLTSATRKNAERVATLLSDEFREFGSSGRVYTKHEMIATLHQEPSVSISAVDVEVKLLTENIALVTYTSRKEQRGAEAVSALRSSIWAKTGDNWSMVFHQGTRIP